LIDRDLVAVHPAHLDVENGDGDLAFLGRVLGLGGAGGADEANPLYTL
jgi:hypothetical protein